MCAMPINEELLEQLETLSLLVKNSIAGMFGGGHKSKTPGSSCEFFDYRDYLPGDDISKIDWHAYARFDKLILKLFLDERQIHTRIYIDCSRSMSFGKGGKDVQAIRLAAAIAYLSVSEMDRVSIYAVKGNSVQEVIHSMLGKEAYLNNISKLNDIVFEGDSLISEAILPSAVGYGDGLSVIISDFLTDNDYEAAIEHILSKRRDVLAVQVLSREELQPKARGKLHYFDSEIPSKFYRKNINRDIIEAYKQALEYVTGRVKAFALSRGANYLLAPADKKIEDILFNELQIMGVIK